MIKVDHEIEINRPVEDVYRFVVDSRNDPEWCPPVLEVEQVIGAGPELGAKYWFVAKPGPAKTNGTFEITQLKENERAEYRGENGMLRFRYAYSFASHDSATTIEMTSELVPKGLWKLLSPVIHLSTKSVTAREFENLKQLLENRRDRPA